MRWTGPEGYWASDEPELVDVPRVHAWLSRESYWAQGRPEAVVAKSIEHSLVVGLYSAGGERPSPGSATCSWNLRIKAVGWAASSLRLPSTTRRWEGSGRSSRPNLAAPCTHGRASPHWPTRNGGWNAPQGRPGRPMVPIPCRRRNRNLNAGESCSPTSRRVRDVIEKCPDSREVPCRRRRAASPPQAASLPRRRPRSSRRPLGTMRRPWQRWWSDEPPASLWRGSPGQWSSADVR